MPDPMSVFPIFLNIVRQNGCKAPVLDFLSLNKSTNILCKIVLQKKKQKKKLKHVAISSKCFQKKKVNVNSLCSNVFPQYHSENFVFIDFL